MVFKREVAAVDRVELDLRHVRGRLHADTREKRVVDPGGYHYLTLVRFEELPCIGNRLPVIPDVVEEIEHDLVDAGASQQGAVDRPIVGVDQRRVAGPGRSEEHTSELQSRENIVCRLLLEKKK